MRSAAVMHIIYESCQSQYKIKRRKSLEEGELTRNNSFDRFMCGLIVGVEDLVRFRFVNVLVYYGLSLGVSKLGSDLYLTQFIFGLVEIPARSLVLLFLPWSRRLSQSGFLALGGVACLLTLTVPTDHPNLITGLAMVGKFGITASFAVIYVYTAEIFPTVLRQTGIGVSSMFARVGGVLAPLINMLHTRSPSLPMLIFGSAPLLGAVLALALPETANRPLPDTVEDAENWDTRFPPKKGQGEDIIQSASSTEGQELQRLATES